MFSLMSRYTLHSCINSLTLLQSPLKEEGLEILTSLVRENSGSGSSVMVVSISGLMISEVDISGSFLGSGFHLFQC